MKFRQDDMFDRFSLDRLDSRKSETLTEKIVKTHCVISCEPYCNFKTECTCINKLITLIKVHLSIHQLLILKMVVLQLLREFAGGTSIHGFEFLVSPKLSQRTKNIWGLLLVVAMIYASMEMRNSVISKYHYSHLSRKILYTKNKGHLQFLWSGLLEYFLQAETLKKNLICHWPSEMRMDRPDKSEKFLGI